MRTSSTGQRKGAKRRKSTTITPVVAAFAISAAAYSRMPQRGPLDLSPLVPFNVAGSGDAARLGIALLIPGTALGVWLLLNFLASIRGPVRGLPQWWLNEATGSEALSRFEPTYNTIAFAVTALLALIHAAIVASFIGAGSWIYPALTLVTGAGMIAVGNILPRVRPNWIVGLRTRRTLSDDCCVPRRSALRSADRICRSAFILSRCVLHCGARTSRHAARRHEQVEIERHCHAALRTRATHFTLQSTLHTSERGMRDNGTTQAIARSIMSSAVLALLFVVGGAAPAHAQAALLGPGAAYLGIGASGMATGELDDALAARGYPTFGRTALAVNLGAYRILSSGVMLGAEWHGLIMGEQAHHENEVGLGGGYGTLGIGYMMKVSPRARLYPRIGLGGGGMGLWIENDSVVAFEGLQAR